MPRSIAAPLAIVKLTAGFFSFFSASNPTFLFLLSWLVRAFLLFQLKHAQKIIRKKNLFFTRLFFQMELVNVLLFFMFNKIRLPLCLINRSFALILGLITIPGIFVRLDTMFKIYIGSSARVWGEPGSGAINTISAMKRLLGRGFVLGFC